MTPKLARYIEAGKSLDSEERLEAAHQLLLTIDTEPNASQNDIDAAWDEVVKGRVHEILTGDAKLVDGREAHARVRAEIAPSRT